MEGILFRDITPILSDSLLLTEMMERIVKDIENLNWARRYSWARGKRFYFWSITIN